MIESLMMDQTHKKLNYICMYNDQTRHLQVLASLVGILS